MTNRNLESFFLKAIERHFVVFESLKKPEFLAIFTEASTLILGALRNGKKILIAGNGGSAADAQHFAAELICKFNEPRAPVPCIALSTDSSILTSIANDFRFEDVFARQVQALGSKGDIFVALSTSGNSGNIVSAIREAKNKGMMVIGLTGRDGGKMKEEVAVLLQIDTTETARIQEAHITLLHTLCQIIDHHLFSLKTC